MQYEKEILVNLLSDIGLSHKLNDNIKPSKHPNMACIEDVFNHVGIKYLYCPDTDSLAVTQVDIADDSGIFNALCHTIIMPTNEGLSVLIVIPNSKDKDDVLEQMADSLDSILPPDISYNIVGII